MQIDIETTFEVNATIHVDYDFTRGCKQTWEHPAEGNEIDVTDATIRELELLIGSKRFRVPLDCLRHVTEFKRAVIEYVQGNHSDEIEIDAMMGG